MFCLFAQWNLLLLVLDRGLKWLRELPGFPENPSSVPSTHVGQLTAACNSSSLGIWHPWSRWAPTLRCTLHMYTQSYLCSSCVWVFFLHVCLCTTCLQRPEEGVGSPGTRVTGCWELPSGCWEWNPCSLEGQPVLLMAEPSPLPMGSIFKRLLLPGRAEWKLVCGYEGDVRLRVPVGATATGI